MKAIIVGGGIGGLTAAIALRRAGIDAQVFERAGRLQEVGAGISLWANALHALDELGMADAVRARIRTGMETRICTARGAALSVTAAGLMQGFGQTLGVLHRAELLALLIRQLEPECLHLNHECTGFTEDSSQVAAQFTGGRTAQGDLLIGADGLHSVIRSQLFGASRPRYAGYTAWRAVVKFTPDPGRITESWGSGQRFGIVPMQAGQVYWFAVSDAPEGERDPAGLTKHNLRKLFRGWHEPIEALIDAADESAILRNDIYDRDPLPGWTQRRVTLLGDAAHPMTPNLGQGACQAIEDAVVLSGCLATSTDIVDALLRYQDRRVARTTRVVRLSRSFGAVAQLRNPLLRSVRNLAIRLTPPQLAARQLEFVVRYEGLTSEERSLLGAGASRDVGHSSD